ncbi:MAG: IS21 family transposase [Thermodesulfovibrionales bacterium]|nr:IS21 family transposase [Thermodesulfovibrionales bacterium]
MYTTIKTLKELGKNKSEIARITGHDWKTVRKVIKNIEDGKGNPEIKERQSMVEAHKEKVIKLLEEGLSAVRIREELAADGFSGSYSAVKKYVRKLKGRQNIFIRIHTVAGHEAQVDFGYVGRTRDDEGKSRKTWVFNMKLSHSRYDYYEKVYDQKVETFINCHINSFEYFGGVPEVVKIDNLKAAILEANFYGPVYQKFYSSFAEYYGFKPIPCRIYRPNDKGKVESGIKYVKSNFLKGRKFINGVDCDRRLRQWMEDANRRIHGTTKKIPFEVFEKEERNKLLPLPIARYQLYRVGTRLVYHDCHIYVDHNYYSVPFMYVGKEVEVEMDDNFLRVFYKGKQIVLHKRIQGRGQFSTDASHYPRYKQYSDTEHQEKYQVKMAEIGVFTEQLFFLILKEMKRYWHQPVKGILSLTKKYPKHIVELACKRALAYGACHYQTVKKICENGTYALPVEFEMNKEVTE